VGGGGRAQQKEDDVRVMPLSSTIEPCPQTFLLPLLLALDSCGELESDT